MQFTVTDSPKRAALAARHVPFNRPAMTDTALDCLAEALHSGRLSGNGPFSHRCADLLRSLTGARHVLMMGSCTHALEMSALLIDGSPGDEVIVPAFTFVSTANAFAMHGYRPVFADCRSDTLNLDPDLLPRLMSPRTRAIVVTHYGGVACQMQEVLAFARQHRLTVIEDNAHGLFGSYRHQPLGSLGELGTLSFHETKNVTCGQGGALLINDPGLIERAEVIRERGTDRSRFVRGETDKYQWIDFGSNWVLSELLAAVLWSQLEARDALQDQRRRIWTAYDAALRDWACRQGVQQPCVPAEAEHPFHLYYLLLPTAEARDRLLRHLNQRDIEAVSHYLPLNLSPFAQRFGSQAGDCPNAESVSDRLVRLPFYAGIEPADQEYVIQAVGDFVV